MYVDGPAAKKALHKYKGDDVDLIMDTQKVFDGEQQEAQAPSSSNSLLQVLLASVLGARGQPQTELHIMQQLGRSMSVLKRNTTCVTGHSMTALP